MSSKQKTGLFLVFFAITTLYIGREMKKWASTPQIIKFEFIASATNVDNLVNSPAWQLRDANGLNQSDKLKVATRWDFLYILSYVFFFISLARTALGNTGKTVKTLSLMLVVMGLSDFIENVLIFSILDGSRGVLPAVMTGFATLKFGLLLAYAVGLVGAVVYPYLKK